MCNSSPWGPRPLTPDAGRPSSILVEVQNPFASTPKPREAAKRDDRLDRRLGNAAEEKMRMRMRRHQHRRRRRCCYWRRLDPTNRRKKFEIKSGRRLYRFLTGDSRSSNSALRPSRVTLAAACTYCSVSLCLFFLFLTLVVVVLLLSYSLIVSFSDCSCSSLPVSCSFFLSLFFSLI